MTSEQLQNARAERWRQAGNPLLTAEETRSWMDDAGLCLFAPRRAHFAAPAPSLVEAVAGAVTDAPTRETVETATTLMKRLAADGALVPLNLFGGAGAFGATAVAGGAGLGSFDAPDFLMAREVLPYVFSLIGGRNWKSGPGDKASPLMVEVWTLLRDDGAKTAAEIQGTLGREVTEAAVLRALAELWRGLRVIPVYDEEETRWDVTQARFAAEMAASQKVAQTTALSALVSLYLDGVVAAGREEIEEFLSPLTARSRVREVVNGMQATRQLQIVSVGAHPLLHVAGSLPEFAEVEEVAQVSEPEGERTQFEKKPFEKRERKPFQREERKPFERRERKPFERGEKRPYSRPRDGERKPYERGEKKPFERGERFASRGEGGEERRPFARKPFGGKPFERGERKPFERKEGFAARGGERPFRPKAEGERPYRKPEERRPYGARPSGGARPFDKERGGERRSFGAGGKFPPKRSGAGAARPWKDRGGEREGERSAGREGGERKFGGERRPFEKKGFEKKPFEPGAKKPFGGPKKFGTAKKFGAGKPGGGKSFGRTSAGGFERGKPEGKRPFFRERTDRERPERERRAKDGEGAPRRREFDAGRREGAGARPARREGGWKPKGSGSATGGKSGFKKPGFKSTGKPGFKSSGKPAFKKAGKAFGKPAFGKSKPGFGKSKPGAGKPAFGKGKPGGFKKAGGFKPPFRKKKEGSGDGE